MKAHRTDVVSLVFGLLLLASAAWWLFGRSVGLGLPKVGWIAAAGLIVFGVLGLVGALRAGRAKASRRTGTDEDDRRETHLP